MERSRGGGERGEAVSRRRLEQRGRGSSRWAWNETEREERGSGSGGSGHNDLSGIRVRGRSVARPVFPRRPRRLLCRLQGGQEMQT